MREINNSRCNAARYTRTRVERIQKKSSEEKYDPQEGRNGRSEETAGDVRSAHGQSRRDDDGVGRRQSAGASRAGRALDGHGERRREALWGATAGRPRNAQKLPDRRRALA